MKRNIIIIKKEFSDELYKARIKYFIKKDSLTLELLETNFYNNRELKKSFMFAGYHNVFLSTMKGSLQYKNKVELLLNGKESRIYLNCLINNSPIQDVFGEWCVNVEYEE